MLEKNIEELNLLDNIELKEIPEIDLYMDQVIQLFESKLDNYKRTQEDKILTKTMINNYVKGKLLMPVTKKKYTKEHIILMSIIYQLKGGLSISDIKDVVECVVTSFADNKEINLDGIYNSYLAMNTKNAYDFQKEVESIENKMKNDFVSDEKEQDVIMVTTLINKANMYRRLAEKIIDNNKEK
jgi:DNA-binding transcriptional MerR regulator